MIQTRRNLLKNALFAATAAGLGASAGCGRSDLGAQTLRFWNGFTGPDGRTILAMVQGYNRLHPLEGVTLQRMEWSTYYNKLFVAGMAGRGPDVFVVHSSAFRRIKDAGNLRPMDDMYSDHGGWLNPSDFNANVLSAITRDGHRWCVPLDVHPLGMFYNRDLFRRAGIVDAAGAPVPPTDRQQFLDAARRICALPSQPGEKIWGFCFSWLRINGLGLLPQFGGGLLDAQGSPDLLASSPSVDAMQFCRSLIADEKIAPPLEGTNDQTIGFRQGRVGIMFHGIFEMPELLRQTDLDWAAAPMPVLGHQHGTWQNSHNLCIDATLRGQRLEAAKQFVRFISDHSLQWAAGGQVPARLSLRDTPAFAAMKTQATFATEVPYGTYEPSVGYILEVENEFDLAFEKVLRGSESAAQATRTAADNIARVKRRYDAAVQSARNDQPKSNRGLA